VRKGQDHSEIFTRRKGRSKKNQQGGRKIKVGPTDNGDACMFRRRRKGKKKIEIRKTNFWRGDGGCKGGCVGGWVIRPTRRGIGKN